MEGLLRNCVALPIILNCYDILRCHLYYAYNCVLIILNFHLFFVLQEIQFSSRVQPPPPSTCSTRWRNTERANSWRTSRWYTCTLKDLLHTVIPRVKVFSGTILTKLIHSYIIQQLDDDKTVEWRFHILVLDKRFTHFVTLWDELIFDVTRWRGHCATTKTPFKCCDIDFNGVTHFCTDKNFVKPINIDVGLVPNDKESIINNSKRI